MAHAPVALLTVVLLRIRRRLARLITRGVGVPDFTVARRGTDPNGRGIYATAYLWDWWQAVVADLGFTPTIVQGAHMGRAGGGAAASAGYHDGGGCFDLRVWDLTRDQQQRLVRTLRRYGAAAWIRDEQHGGMDPHLHFVLGTDSPLASGAAYQWQQYLDGRDGLASNGPDYHWRPDPLITTPPEDDMPLTDKDIERIAEAVQRKLHGGDQSRFQRLKARITDAAKSARQRDHAMAAQLEAIAKSEDDGA